MPITATCPKCRRDLPIELPEEDVPARRLLVTCDHCGHRAGLHKFQGAWLTAHGPKRSRWAAWPILALAAVLALAAGLIARVPRPSPPARSVPRPAPAVAIAPTPLARLPEPAMTEQECRAAENAHRAAIAAQEACLTNSPESAARIQDLVVELRLMLTISTTSLAAEFIRAESTAGTALLHLDHCVNTLRGQPGTWQCEYCPGDGVCIYLDAESLGGAMRDFAANSIETAGILLARECAGERGGRQF